MSKRKDIQPDVPEESTAKDRPKRGGGEPDTMQGPGGRDEAQAEEDAINKSNRRGER
jgi:hypothetical protein